MVLDKVSAISKWSLKSTTDYVLKYQTHFRAKLLI